MFPNFMSKDFKLVMYFIFHIFGEKLTLKNNQVLKHCCATEVKFHVESITII